MNNMQNVDLAPLLQPISPENPCGDDYSFSNDFHELKKAQVEDDPLLDLGEWVAEPKQADWSFVSTKTVELLTNTTKDIRLLTWLSSAWANIYGFSGITQSLELSHRMLEQYWSNIHPLIEDEDLDQRLGLLQGLVSQIPLAFKKQPLVNTAPFYSIIDYEKMLHQQNAFLKNPDNFEHDEHSKDLELFEKSLATMSHDEQLSNYQDFLKALEHWETLKTVLDQFMGLDAPSFAQIDSQLESVKTILSKVYKTEQMQAQCITENTDMPTFGNEEARPQAISQQQPTFGAFQPSPQSHLENREQAIAALLQIAEYFKTNEPHSPVSYMLQKTIKWSKMPLHEWLTHVIKDDHHLGSLQDMLDVPRDSY